MTQDHTATMRIRKDLPQPLFRQDFSDWMFKQHRWTLKVQDSTLSRLTAPLYEALISGKLCGNSYDPYVALEKALFVEMSVPQARKILNYVENILNKAIRNTESQSYYWDLLNNWRAAWNIYSEYMESEVFPKK